MLSQVLIKQIFKTHYFF